MAENERNLEDQKCRPLSDEEFAEYQKEQQKKDRKVWRILNAIWEVINGFFS